MITAPVTNITIYENDKNLNGIVNVTVNDLDKDYSNSRYSLEILSDVEEVGDQISLWPSESSALTAQVLFQLKPVTDNEDSIFDYETRDKLEFQLKVTGLNESYMDSINFTINILVRPIILQKISKHFKIVCACRMSMTIHLCSQVKHIISMSKKICPIWSLMLSQANSFWPKTSVPLIMINLQSLEWTV